MTFAPRRFDVQFGLFDALTGGSLVGFLRATRIAVAEGLSTVSLG